jgi:hypothetical protein
MAGYAAFKLVGMGAAYAQTIVSDAVTTGRMVWNALRPTVVANRVALVGHRVAALASAAATRVQTAATAMQNAVMAVARSRFVASAAAVARNTANMLRQGVVSTALAVKTGVVTAAQWALNAAMSANPLGIVIVAIAAVVAGFVALYRNSEKFRNIVGAVCSAVAGFFSALWNGIMSAASTVWNAISAVVTAPIETIKSIWSGVGGFFTGLWDGIVEAAKAPFDWIAAKFEWVTSTWNSVKGVFTSLFGSDEEEAAQTVAQPARAVAPTYTANPYGMAPAHAPAPAAGSSAPRPASPAPNVPGRAMSLGMQISMPITFNGVPSKDVGELLVGAVRSKEGELRAYFEKLIEGIASNQRRLAYDQ